MAYPARLLEALPDEPISAIGYIRVSLAREEMISPEIQRAAITNWARNNNRRIVDWIEDLDETGRNFKRKIMGGIERIEKRDAREIAAYRYDRWGRNARESLANCHRVELVGGQLRSATEPFDVETAVGKYSRTNAFAIAEMQSDIIGDNWRDAQAARVNRGLTQNGSPRFGYVRLGRVRNPADPIRYMRDLADPDGERYEPDYTGGMADIHIEMYGEYIGGKGFQIIAQWLNLRGIRNTRGNPWSDVTVKNVLDSGFAAGYIQKHDPECPCKKPSGCKRRVHVEGAHDPIIKEEEWQRYLKARKERHKMPPRARYPRYPLSGVILCGHCDHSMKIQSGGSPPQRGYAYRCSRWHHYRDCRGVFPQRLEVEAEVLKTLGTWAVDIDERSAITTARKAARVAADADADRLGRALVENDAALKRLAKQRALDGDRMPDGVYEETRDELLETRGQIEAELVRTKEVVTVNRGEYIPIVRGLLDEWDILSAGERREMLAKLLRHVKVFRNPGGRPRVETKPVWESCSCAACDRKAKAV